MAVRFYDGEAIPESLLKPLWRLRVSMLELRRSEEEDFALFRRVLVGPDRAIFVFVDEHEAPVGFFTHAFMPCEVGGRRSLLLYTKFYYFHRDYRGHPKSALAPWLLLPYTWKRYGLRRLHFVATAFPQSYVSLWRSSGRLYSLRDDDTPQDIRTALEAFAQRFCSEDFDREQGLVRSETVVDSPWAPQTPESLGLNERYERLNPDWKLGYTLPILFTLDARLVRTNVRRMGRRWMRG